MLGETDTKVEDTADVKKAKLEIEAKDKAQINTSTMKEWVQFNCCRYVSRHSKQRLVVDVDDYRSQHNTPSWILCAASISEL